MDAMRENILRWFATGRVGMSSKAMACCIAGIDVDEKSHPYDPDDLNRCLLFLQAVPEAREYLHRCAALSATWMRLIDQWDELEATFLEEVGLNWSKGQDLRASKTYAMMQQIRNI